MNEQTFCNLADPLTWKPRPLNGVVVSFAPIWLLADFLSFIALNNPVLLSGLQGVIACSSSSYLTKKYSFNIMDQKLAATLEKAHAQLYSFCKFLSIPCQILAPTMIYGSIERYMDKNLGTLIRIMRRTPLIVLPETVGLRQPVHASQLACVALVKAQMILFGDWSEHEPFILTLGGDEILSYREMLTKLQGALRRDDAARKCRILSIPDRLFYALAAPLLPLNPKTFEAITRIKSNLSGFEKAHVILQEKPKLFPVLPLPQ